MAANHMSREAGKGDRNRSIGSKYRNGYDLINWGKNNVSRQSEVERRQGHNAKRDESNAEKRQGA